LSPKKPNNTHCHLKDPTTHISTYKTQHYTLPPKDVGTDIATDKTQQHILPLKDLRTDIATYKTQHHTLPLKDPGKRHCHLKHPTIHNAT